MCDPHFGVGADGILIVSRPQHPLNKKPSTSETISPYEMTIYNADGSLAKMCGNGLRCVVKYLSSHHQLFSKPQENLTIMTGGGPFTVHQSRRTSPDLIGIDMGWPDTIGERSLFGEVFSIYSFGNPHIVTYDPNHFQERSVLAHRFNELIEDGVNVSFAEQLNAHEIRLHVHERGCGWTLACGTGACATVYQGYVEGRFALSQTIKVYLPGGELDIEINEQGLLMWGPAHEVYQGELFSSLG